MKVIAISGPRRLDNWQFEQVEHYLQLQQADLFLTGDAAGVDAIARHWLSPEVFQVEGRQPYHFHLRTIKMIDALAEYQKAGHDVLLIAFPNKSCDSKCKPAEKPTANGSGTWLALAAAKYRNIPIDLQPLAEFDLPYWLAQLSLF